MKFTHLILAVLLVLFPVFLGFDGFGRSGFVAAEDDIVEGEDDASVEVEDSTTGDDTAAIPLDTEAETEDAEEEKLKPSPDAETSLLFVKPATPTELVAGGTVRMLVGFVNKGSKNFQVDNMDASFHYPQDYSYIIHNFTAYRYQSQVEPGREATFEYAFTPSEMFGARPFVLTVNLNYRDADGAEFQDAVFNTTINMVEKDDGLDGETFFLYIFLMAVIALLLFAAYHFLSSYGKRKRASGGGGVRRPAVETGTQSNKNDVDYDWLPKETLDALNKSPGRSPQSKTSPKLRTAAAAKRRLGAADD